MKHTKKLNRQLILSLGIIFLFIFSSLASALPIKILGSGTPGIGQERLFTLTIHIEGNGEVYPPSGSQFKPGKSTPVFALSSDNWVFRRWEGDLTGSENPSFLHMDSDKTITAVFDQYVSIENGKFMYQDEPFYPITMNYGIHVQKDDSGFFPGPYRAYFPDNKPSANKDVAMNRMSKHMQQMVDLGFTSIRILGLSTGYNNDTQNLHRAYIDKVNGVYVNTPLDITPDTYHILFSVISDVVELAESHGLKVVLLAGNRGIDHPDVRNQYSHYLGSLANHFADNPTLMAIDIYNEPSNEARRSYKKSEISLMVSQWCERIRKNSSYHLITMGHQHSKSALDWDPKIMPLDFDSFHIYPEPREFTPQGVHQGIQRFQAELLWTSQVIQRPWIIGETGFSAHYDPDVLADWGSPEDQRYFAYLSLRSVRDLGGIGYSWYRFVDNKKNPTHNPTSADRKGFWGLLSVSFPESPEWPDGSIKPSAYEFNDFDPYTIEHYAPEINEIYYNPYNYSKYELTAKIITPTNNHDKNALYKPVENARINAFSAGYEHFSKTFSKPDGTFHIKSERPIRMIYLSGLGFEGKGIYHINTMYLGLVNSQTGSSPTLEYESLVNCYTHGVFGVTEYGDLIRAFWTYPQGWDFEFVHSNIQSRSGSFIYTGDQSNPGQLFGLNAHGKIVEVTYNPTLGKYIAEEIPGQQSIPSLVTGSLVYSPGRGLFAVSASGQVIRALKINEEWSITVIRSSAGSIHPTSLIATNQESPTPILGVTIDGTIVGIFDQKLVVEEIPIPLPPISLSSLVYGNDDIVYGVTTDSQIIKIFFEQEWDYTLIEYEGSIQHDSLSIGGISPTRVFGINDEHHLVYIKKDKQTNELTIELVNTKDNDLFTFISGSLVNGYENGIFGITEDGKLIQTNVGWNFISISSSSGQTHPFSLVSSYNTEGGRVYGLNENGKLIGTWVKPNVDIGDIVLQPVDFS
jgi:hypothetical protein